MIRSKMFLLAAPALIAMATVSGRAFAQPVKPTPAAPAATPAPSGGGPCDSASQTCQDAFGDCQTQRDADAKSLEYCQDPNEFCRKNPTDERCKAKKPTGATTPPKPKPFKWKCEGGKYSFPEEDGNDCKCGEGFVAVVEKLVPPTKVCVSTQDTEGIYIRLHNLEMDLWNYQKNAPQSSDDGELKKFIVIVKGLYGRMYDNPGGVLVQISAITIRLDEIDRRLDDHERRLGDAEEAIANLHSGAAAGLSAVPFIWYRPGAGVAGGIMATFDFKYRFADTPVSLIAEGGGGFVSSEATGPGGVTQVGAGVSFDLAGDAVHNLDVGAMYDQYISIHSAGYQELPSQGRGYAIGPYVGYKANLAEYFQIGVRFIAGYGDVDYNVRAYEYHSEPEFQPIVQITVGPHTEW